MRSLLPAVRQQRPARRPHVVVASLVAALLVAGCTGGGGDGGGGGGGAGGTDGAAPATEEAGERLAAEVSAPGEDVTVVDADGAAQALEVSRALYDAAPVVVLAGPADLAGQARAASVAVALHAPLLLASPGEELRAELDRLGTRTVLTVGDTGATGSLGEREVVSAPDDEQALGDLLGERLGEARSLSAGEEVLAAVAALDPEQSELLVLEEGASTSASATARAAATDGPAASPAAATGDAPAEDAPTEDATASAPAAPTAEELPDVERGDALEDVLVLMDPAGTEPAAVATARAAGADVLAVPEGDPRRDGTTVDALAGRSAGPVLAVGSAFGTAERLSARLAVARTGQQLPGGGQVLFPGRRMVALYGHPGSTALGALGEQPLDAAIDRAARVAADYDALLDEPVVPTFEIIATIADAAAGADGDYSAEADVETLRPWVEAAGEAGYYVVLDLQPGRTDFLTQAQLYEELLRLPYVGLALDPEWRLAPGQRHLRQIGSVEAAEVNSVVEWLADLTRDAELPQKLLIVHQFRHSMIKNRDSIDTSRDELAVLIHADGNGARSVKIDSWQALTSSYQDGLWWGWKNFYDEDSPTWTAAETLELEPPVRFVSYQ